MRVDSFLELAASTHPDRVAVTCGADAVTYAELLAAAVATTQDVVGAGSVAFLGVNGIPLPVAAFGASCAGIPFAPLNYRLDRDRLHALLLRLDRPHVLGDTEHAAGVAGTAQLEPDAAVIVFTSGTTADPKGVILTHEQLGSYILATVDFAAATETDAALVCVPPYHIAGVAAILSNVFAGRRIVYLPDFSPAGWLDCVRRESISSAMVVPTMLARIVEHLGGETADVPSLRTLSYGGSRMPRPVLEAALRAFPECDFVNAYGLTETSSTIALLSPADHRAALASPAPEVQARLDSVGRLIDSVEGEVRDGDGSVLPAPAAGALWVRGPQISGRYMDLGSALDGDGWFPTRDQAHFDEDGYLFIHGRADDTIIRGGENIAPAEIEDTLLRHPGVRDAAVLGVPDDEWGERLVAVVVTDVAAAIEGEEIRAWVRERLRSSRTPDQVVFRGELPRTDTGKIRRGLLVEDLVSREGGQG